MDSDLLNLIQSVALAIIGFFAAKNKGIKK